MSSRRRRSRQKTQETDAFTPQHQDPANLEGFADMLYSTGEVGQELMRLDGRPTRIKSISLERIGPDPAQARRVMPSILRSRWLHRPHDVPTVLDEWMQQAQDEVEQLGRPPLNVPEMLRHDPADTAAVAEDTELPEPGPVEHSFRALVQLAASIALHGLANPITVVQQPDGSYQLETGERRLLAYNLLHSVPNLVEGDWSQIPCRVMEEKDIWRQAAENGAREDLNAISMARQLALLLMDIYQDKVAFARYGEMPGVEWYAQVYDSKRFPVPYGRGAELAAAMGLKSAGQVRQYRQLLGLPAEVWELADELDWTEYKIREMMRQARNVTTVTDSESDTESVTTVTEFENRLLALAHYEAGVTHSLPQGLGDEIGVAADAATGSRPRKKSKRSRIKATTVAKNASATVTDVDDAAGTVTLHIDQPHILEALQHGHQLIITVKRVDDKG